MKKKYEVKIPVWEVITVVVEATTTEKAEILAVAKAVKEQPRVYWQVDMEADIEIRELD